VDDEIRALIDDLFETMYAGNGVGLAATQLGIAHRVVTIDTTPRQEGSRPLALVNPVLVKAEGATREEEGCLSVPGEFEAVKRAARVWVKALDRDGKELEIEGEGLLAVALQHEIDHLDGVLFVDHISALKRELIKRRMKRLKIEREEEKRSGKKATDTGGEQPAL
jgi:peptide deformylase